MFSTKEPEDEQFVNLMNQDEIHLRFIDAYENLKSTLPDFINKNLKKFIVFHASENWIDKKTSTPPKTFDTFDQAFDYMIQIVAQFSSNDRYNIIHQIQNVDQEFDHAFPSLVRLERRKQYRRFRDDFLSGRLSPHTGQYVMYLIDQAPIVKESIESIFKETESIMKSDRLLKSTYGSFHLDPQQFYAGSEIVPLQSHIRGSFDIGPKSVKLLIHDTYIDKYLFGQEIKLLITSHNRNQLVKTILELKARAQLFFNCDIFSGVVETQVLQDAVLEILYKKTRVPVKLRSHISQSI